MPRTFPELPDWSFDADEASVGVYRAFGRDRAGRNVEASGVDPEALIETCRQAALRMTADIQTSSDSPGR
jgi:hypothetical protein